MDNGVGKVENSSARFPNQGEGYERGGASMAKKSSERGSAHTSTSSSKSSHALPSGDNSMYVGGRVEYVTYANATMPWMDLPEDATVEEIEARRRLVKEFNKGNQSEFQMPVWGWVVLGLVGMAVISGMSSPTVSGGQVVQQQASNGSGNWIQVPNGYDARYGWHHFNTIVNPMANVVSNILTRLPQISIHI